MKPTLSVSTKPLKYRWRVFSSKAKRINTEEKRKAAGSVTALCGECLHEAGSVFRDSWGPCNQQYWFCSKLIHTERQKGVTRISFYVTPGSLPSNYQQIKRTVCQTRLINLASHAPTTLSDSWQFEADSCVEAWMQMWMDVSPRAWTCVIGE